MAQDFIQIYPPDAALCTEARQQLYTDLLENVELGEFKKKPSPLRSSACASKGRSNRATSA